MHISSPVLAFLTTIHLACVVLRAHRSPSKGAPSFVTFISLLFAATPWLLPTPAGIASGFAAHIAWWLACERFLPTAAAPAAAAQRVTAPPGPRAPVAKPAPLVTAGTPRPATAARPPRAFVMAPVLSVNDETPTIRTFRIARPDGFDFKAGQFLPVRVRAEGREHVRCYSISSSPEARGYLEISVRRIGLVSGTLHATLRPGSMLAIKHPAGAFTYPGGEDRPLLFIAGGVGITPLMSMARHAVTTEPMRPVTLLYSIRTEEDFAFRDEIEFLDRRHPQFRAFVAVSDGPVGAGFFPGMLNESLFQTTMPDVAHTTCMLCGPPPMRDALTKMLIELGVPRPQIHYEIFEAAKAAAGSQPEPDAPAAPRRNPTHEARFTRSGTSERVTETQTLLEAAESCGAAIPSLCRAGVCGTCRTRVTEGDVECASTLLDDQDRHDGFVLPCVSHLKSDCAVEA